MVRSFIAIEVPEAIRNQIFESFDQVRRKTSGIKWVEPAQMHLTLQFLGEAEESLIEEEVIPRMSEATAGEAAFQLHVTGVGLFPSVHKPRIFWVGMEGDSVRLKRIQSKVEKCLAGLPLHQDKKEFHAHLTLGRIKVPNSIGLWHKILEEYEKIDFGSFAVESLILFKSELTSSGPVYTRLKEFKLK